MLQDVTGSTSVSLLTSAGGAGAALTQVAGKTIFTPSLLLAAANGGDIGTSTTAIRTSAGDISAVGTGVVFLNSTGNANLVGTSSGTTFRLVANGDIQVQGDVYSNNLTLISGSNGNIDLRRKRIWFRKPKRI